MKRVGAGDLSSALSQLSPTGMKPSGTLWGGKGQVFEYLCVLFLSVCLCVRSPVRVLLRLCQEIRGTTPFVIHLCRRHWTKFGSLNACNSVFSFLLSEQKLFRTIGQQTELEPESFAIRRAQAGVRARPEASLSAEVAMMVSDLAMLANALASISQEAATMITPSTSHSVVSEPLKDLSGTQMLVDADDSQLLYNERKRRAAGDLGEGGNVQVDVEPTKSLEFKSSEDTAQTEEGLPATTSNEPVLVAHDAQEEDEPTKDASEPIKAEVNLDSLNVNELKERLMAGGIVDFGNCFEKSNLMDKIKTLGNYANVDVAAAPGYKIQNVNDTEPELVTDVAPGVVQEESANLVELETEQADLVTASNGPAPAIDDSNDHVPANE